MPYCSCRCRRRVPPRGGAAQAGGGRLPADAGGAGQPHPRQLHRPGAGGDGRARVGAGCRCYGLPCACLVGWGNGRCCQICPPHRGAHVHADARASLRSQAIHTHLLPTIHPRARQTKPIMPRLFCFSSSASLSTRRRWRCTCAPTWTGMCCPSALMPTCTQNSRWAACSGGGNVAVGRHAAAAAMWQWGGSGGKTRWQWWVLLLLSVRPNGPLRWAHGVSLRQRCVFLCTADCLVGRNHNNCQPSPPPHILTLRPLMCIPLPRPAGAVVQEGAALRRVCVHVPQDHAGTRLWPGSTVMPGRALLHRSAWLAAPRLPPSLAVWQTFPA